MKDNWLMPLRRVLDHSREPVRFYFRDDNVGHDDARLYEMLDLFAIYEIPVDLSANRHLLSRSLARNLRARRYQSKGRLALHSQQRNGVKRGLAAQLLVKALLQFRLHASMASSPNTAHATLTHTTVMPARVNWCRHPVGERGPRRQTVGRYLAVQAARRHAIEFIVDHARLGRAELISLAELLHMLGQNRKARCLPLREQQVVITANAIGELRGH